MVSGLMSVIIAISQKCYFNETDQGQKYQGSEQSTQQHRNQGESVRIEKRDQQKASSSRYVTAAGSDFNPITMKTKVAEEFLRPQGDSQAKAKAQAETAEPPCSWRQHTHTQSGNQSGKQHPEAAEQTSNWRQRANNKSQEKQQPASWRQNQRQQGGSSSGAGKARTEAPVAVVEPATNTTPQAQTLALMSILGLKQSSDQLQKQPQQPVSKGPLQAPLPQAAPMPQAALSQAPMPQAPLPQAALPQAPLPGEMPVSL